MTWEYKVVPVSLEVHLRRYKAYKEGKGPKDDSIEHILNEYGAKGWELVAIEPEWMEEEDQTYVYAYFKR